MSEIFQLSPAHTRWKRIAGLFIVLCILADFFPHRGPPQFRYTGSDPAIAVWNLGWPLATAIYDSRNGLHVGPTALVLPLQCALFAAGMVAVSIMRWRFGSAKASATPQFDPARTSRALFPWPSVFFAINFSAAVCLLTICLLSIAMDRFSPDTLAQVALILPALAFAWGEWLLYFRKVESLELPMGRLCGAIGALVLLSFVVNAAAALISGESMGIWFWLVFGGGSLAFSAYCFLCCRVRTRASVLRRPGGFPVIPLPQSTATDK